MKNIISAMLAVFVLFCVASSAAQAKPSSDAVTLLVPGMKYNLKSADMVWGQPDTTRQYGEAKWSGMIGQLQHDGEVFGGVVRPEGAEIELPRHLDKTGAESNRYKASLFALEFSEAANVDGIAMKTLELAATLQALQRYTGCKKFRIVAFSAGGVITRAYLQNALPLIKYRGEVEQLITIATPHMGSMKAEHFGDFLGTRASSLKPSSPLIKRLNDKLDLPAGVNYASIIVRGRRIGSRGLHNRAEKHLGSYVDQPQIARLPLDYQKGYDQVVNVWSQNLSLTRAGRRYQQSTGRPIQYIVARVDDPSPRDWCYLEPTVHEVAASSPEVTQLVSQMLGEREFWTGLSSRTRHSWQAQQTELCVTCVLEDAMARKHSWCEVQDTKLETINLKTLTDGRIRADFTGSATACWRVPPYLNASNKISGSVTFKLDKYGRCVSANHTSKVE